MDQRVNDGSTIKNAADLADLSGIAQQLADVQLIGDARASKLDHEFKAAVAKIFLGMSPIEIAIAYLDWLSHLAISPGRQLQLAQSFTKKCSQLGLYGIALLLERQIEKPNAQLEARVNGENWQRLPFNLLAQAHQLAKDFVNEATSDVAGVTDSHQELVKFIAEQVMDFLSPANHLLTNPDVHQQTRVEKGQNLARGANFLKKDIVQTLTGKPAAPSTDFQVGKAVGVTPGKVVFRNDLLELIQYTPTTETVGAEPVLFCPAWIMKYYILDLSPKNSMVKYLVEQGKTVFIISWKNPGPEDRDTGFEDYVTEGLLSAIDIVEKIVPNRKINLTGYCIGGTLALIGAATMARNGDDRLNSLSLFTAQGDFSEAGEVMRFISDSQLEFADKLMWKKGLLGSEEMGGSFGALRASDLIYGTAVNRYLMGNDHQYNDLMAWNADGTRMPYRMHTEYLHKLYLRNELATNKFEVGARPISLADLRVPTFSLGTEGDHVAPWKSVYKLQGLTHHEFTFALTSGGHNAGVICGPAHPRRHHRIHTRQAGDKYISPDEWVKNTEVHQGSWWPAWDAWLDNHISERVAPPKTGGSRKGVKIIGNAPGSYVLG